MTTGARGGTGRKAKIFAACAVAALSSLVATVPASAIPVDVPVRDGRNIMVVHNTDLVAASGYTPGQKLTVDLYRGGKRIATASGPAAGGVLEVNHAEGAPAEGECWENFTPDVRPGDEIRVTGDGGTDRILVDDITMNEPRAVEGTNTVIVEGRASYADGIPIPENLLLQSGEVRQGSGFRANPTAVERIEGTQDGYRAVYSTPYEVTRGGGLSLDRQREAILQGDHTMGYGHTEPPPTETQLVEEPGANGPSAGCATRAPAAPASAMGVTTPKLINQANQDGNVEVGGTIQDGVDVQLQLNGADAGVAADVDRQNGTWSASIPAANFQENGNRVTATFTGTGVPGEPQTANVHKDTTPPPAATADPAPGRYKDDKFVKLGVEGARTNIFYTTGDGEPDKEYGGESIPVTSEPGAETTTTIKTRTFDAAGNAGEVTPLVYEIDKVVPAAPLSNLAAGSYDGAQKLVFTSDAADLKEIRYTTDGKTPAANSGAVFPPGGSVDVTKTTTFKAVAVDRAGNLSPVLDQKITIRTATTTTLGVATADLKLGNSRTISGAVLPPRGSGSVKLTIDRPGTLPTISRNLTLDVFSRYGFSYKPNAPGTYRITASFAKNADSLASTSATKSFRVVR